jgi:PadR family transcriptional regulator, regulatory protein PadR
MDDNGSATQLRRGVAGPCILALLETGPQYGLEIVTQLDAAGQLLTSKGTVYPLLARLSDAGWVRSDWQVADGERPRRYYTLTDAGRRELESFRDEWSRFSTAVDTLLGGRQPAASNV